MTPQKIIIGGAALNQIPLDWDGNCHRILQAIDQAKQKKVSLLCLPELCISGYGCEDAFHSTGVSEMAWQSLLQIAPRTQSIAVAVGLPFLANQVVYNTIAWLCDGKIRGIVAKQFLPGQDVYYETRWFKPWPSGKVQIYTLGNETFPIGDLIFDLEGIRVGFEICEDAWVANRPATRLANWGVDILLNSSASHFAFGQYQIRRSIVEEGARSTSTAYVYSNLLGCEAGRIIYDGTVLIASGNQGIVATGPRFSYQDVILTTAVVDLENTRLQRRKNVNYQPTTEVAQHIIDCPFPQVTDSSQSLAEAMHQASSQLDQYNKFEEFSYAVSLGLWDYLRKSKSQGFVVSLSGGADSTTVAMLIYLMANLAFNELGWRAFSQKLSHLTWLNTVKEKTVEAVMFHLLYTIYQASDHSSETTQNAAKTISTLTHSHHMEFNIAAVVTEYTSWLEGELQRPLSWEKDDLALQNIQARVRAPSAWLVANTTGSLLLSTSNRSESAVGYATMDGDTSGGLSPIAGIDKAFILQWLKWIETSKAVGLGPFPEVSAITQQKPTAELRPKEDEQSDEADLMPYLILDAIERLAIRDRKMPLQVWHDLQLQFTNEASYTSKQLAQFVEKFFQLWSRNQWKRERYAPSFHLDDENLDPKTWCRFPILSGGFIKELQLLREAVEAIN